MGARIQSRDGHAPLVIDGGELTGISGRRPWPARKSRAPSCWPGCTPRGTTIVHEPLATRDHTERCFPAFGIDILVDGRTCAVEGGQEAVAPAARLRGAGQSIVGGRVGRCRRGPAGVVGAPRARVRQSAARRIPRGAGAHGRRHRRRLLARGLRRAGRDFGGPSRRPSRDHHRGGRGTRAHRRTARAGRAGGPGRPPRGRGRR